MIAYSPYNKQCCDEVPECKWWRLMIYDEDDVPLYSCSLPPVPEIINEHCLVVRHIKTMAKSNKRV